jgi:UDP-2,3-diacylglucosamine hydrolase
MADLLVSDLHLCCSRPEINDIFMRFLAGPARRAHALYILGDLFEYWAGDEDLLDPLNSEICAQLRRLADSGVPVSFIPGNRDFLTGEDFSRTAGLTMLSDPALVRIGGQDTILTHGDTLCTDDRAYMAFRAMVRNDAWRRDFLGRPLAERKARIEAVRETSEAEKQRKPGAIMDANTDAIADAFRRHGYARLIHGHTHRPAQHWHTVDGNRCERWVLAAWFDGGSYLECDEHGCRAIPFP